MSNARRQQLLKIIVIACLGILALDWVVIGPFLRAWKAQGERIAELREKVENGRSLLQREASLRERVERMRKINLPVEESAAEIAANRALTRWARSSQIDLSGYTTTPWQTRDEIARVFETRITANGTQATLGRFLYELESDSTLPVSLEDCELSTRDARGGQLTLTARITFLRLKDL